MTLAQAAALFTAPGLVAAGAALVAIPIVIHLLSRFRRRRQTWGAMRFIWEAYEKQRRRLQMEQIVLLVVRCLIVLTLGLALSGPILSGCSEQLRAVGLVETTGRTAHIVVDDSVATRAIEPDTGLPRFAGVRELAERVRASSAAERVRYWPTSLEEGAPDEQVDPGAGTEASSGTLPEAPTFQRADLGGALARVAEAIAAEGSPQRQDAVVVVSPLSRGSLDAQAPPPSPEAWDAVRERVRLLVTPPMPGVSNVQIVSVRPRRGVVVAGPGGRAIVPVDVALRRFDALDTGLNARLRVAILDREGRVLGEAERAVPFPAGDGAPIVNLDVAVDDVRRGPANAPNAPWPVALRATLEGLEPATDALAEDSMRWATLELRGGLRVGVIDEASTGDAAALRPARWAALALAPRGSGAVEVIPVPPATLRGEEDVLRGLDAAVLLRPDLLSEAAWTRLATFAEAGGLVWVTAPATEGSAGGWTRAMRDAFALDWQLGVEPQPIGGENGVAPTTERDAPEALELLAADWDALVRPVRVWRWVPVTTPEAEAWLPLPRDGQTPAGHLPALLAHHPHGRGGILFLSTALDAAWTSLPTKPLFVPLVHEAVRGALGAAREERPLVVGALEPGLRRLLPLDAESAGGNRSAGTPAPGIYERRGSLVAANIDPAAGDARAVDEAALARYLDALGTWAYLDPADPGTSLRGEGVRGPNIGWALLWLVLALVLLETLLARVFSHAGDAANRGLAAAVVGRMRRFYRVHHPEQERQAA